MHLRTISFLVGISLSATAFAAAGNYPSVSCSSSTDFSKYSCNQCFNGGSIQTGGKIDNLYDLWTNQGTGSELIYQSKQNWPSLQTASSGTVFVATPSSPADYWKYGDDVLWVNSALQKGDKEFSLDSGKTVRLFDSNFGANYTLTQTDKTAGDTIAMLLFPLHYSPLDSEGNEGTGQTYTECVAFKLAASPVKTVTPVPPAPKPQQVTTTKTGPETNTLIILTLIVAAVLVAVRKKKVN